MSLLLDTHVVIWCFTNDPTLSKEARQAIVDGETEVFVSAASAWEITIKRALGKLQAPDNFEDELIKHRFTPLPITIPHVLAVGTLPFHHNDPFDRILVAQAKVEGLTLVTRDKDMKKYGVPFVAALYESVPYHKVIPAFWTFPAFRATRAIFRTVALHPPNDENVE